MILDRGRGVLLWSLVAWLAGCAGGPDSYKAKPDATDRTITNGSLHPASEASEVVRILRNQPFADCVAFDEFHVKGLGYTLDPTDAEKADHRTIDRRSRINIRLKVPEMENALVRTWLGHKLDSKEEFSVGELLASERLREETDRAASDLEAVFDRIDRPTLPPPASMAGSDNAAKSHASTSLVQRIERIEQATAMRGARRIWMTAEAFSPEGQPKGGPIEVQGYSPPAEGEEAASTETLGAGRLAKAEERARAAKERAASRAQTIWERWGEVRELHLQVIQSRELLMSSVRGIDPEVRAGAESGIGVTLLGTPGDAGFWSPGWLEREGIPPRASRPPPCWGRFPWPMSCRKRTRGRSSGI